MPVSPAAAASLTTGQLQHRIAVYDAILEGAWPFSGTSVDFGPHLRAKFLAQCAMQLQSCVCELEARGVQLALFSMPGDGAYADAA